MLFITYLDDEELYGGFFKIWVIIMVFLNSSAGFMRGRGCGSAYPERSRYEKIGGMDVYERTNRETVELRFALRVMR